jgi:hypothetical protein
VDVGARHLIGSCHTCLFDAAVPRVHAIWKKKIEENECCRQPVDGTLQQGDRIWRLQPRYFLLEFADLAVCHRHNPQGRLVIPIVEFPTIS